MRASVALALALVAMIASACAGQSSPVVRRAASPTASAGAPADLDLTPYVNPFIGTSEGGSKFTFYGNSGDTFPGAAYPMGMVQWSPDTPSPLPGGYYYPDSSIDGFSLTHYSGRGCPSYEDIPFMPYVGPLNLSPVTRPLVYRSTFSHSREAAHPGFYQVHLNGPDVGVELSVTPRTGLGRFTYPASTAATMLLNAGGSVRGNSNAGVRIDAGSQQVTGFDTSTLGCGTFHYTLYFAAQFDRPFSSFGTWQGGTVSHGSAASAGGQSGAFVSFDTTSNPVVQVRVGISFGSVANARANLAAEDNTWDFTAVRQRADAAWNARLNSIQVQGGTPDEMAVFYTALYHAFFHPNLFSDANGQYIGFDGAIHTVASGHAQYENIHGWDHYRTLLRLRAILAPSETSDVLQSLVNDAQQGDGHLPRWEQTNADSLGQNGDDGDPMIAGAYAFGATGFDTASALHAMLAGQPRVREGLSDYLRLGYVAATTTSNSADITLEYVTDDFSIAQFATMLGQTCIANTYLKRSGNWQRLWNPASGYIQPRYASGAWVTPFSPTSEAGFQEGDSAQYTWMVPFNLRGLFDRIGGNAAAVRRLDRFFTKLNDGAASPYAFMGNEPSIGAPWEYDFAGAPSHTQDVVRRIQTQLYRNTTGGLPGNDDGGTMSAWYVFSALGLYPEIPGVGGFVVGSPLFASATIRLAGGHTLQINAPAAAGNAPYVQSMSLNGAPTTSTWVPWAAVKDGATLDFALSTTATGWGTGTGDAPPSQAAQGPGAC